MELDTKIWFFSNLQKEKSICIHNRWNCYTDWLETLLFVDSNRTVHKTLLGIYISESRNILVAENFIRSLVSKYGRHTVYTDGGTWYP